MVKISKNKFINVEILVADVEDLPFENDSFDFVVASFLIVHLKTLTKAFDEIYRVLKDGGELFILEFSEPTNRLVSPFYKFYSYKVMPFIAGCFTQRYAYDYLPESIDMFPSREQIKQTLESLNFRNIKF